MIGESDNRLKLPEGWTSTTFRGVSVTGKYSIVDGPFGSQMKVHEFTTQGIPVIEMHNLGGKYIESSFRRFITEDKLAEVERSKVIPNDIVISKTGTLGKVSIVPENIQIALMTSRLAKISLELRSIDLVYAWYFMVSLRLSEYWENTGKGTTMKVLTIKNIADTNVPLPPLPEQHRIVAKIEELFSELDKGVENLKTAHEQLKVYRQAVLKHAFEGKLTEQWRKEHASELERAEMLLKKIKTEREQRYQQQLEEWQQAAKTGKRLSKPAKPEELPPLSEGELAELPKLPEGWGWMYLGNLNADVFDGPFGSNLKTSDYVSKGIRVIRLENIGNLEFRDDNKSFITEEKYVSIQRHTVMAGDIIFSSFMADGTRVVILPDYIKTAINKADCFCIRVFGGISGNQFLATFLSTQLSYRQLESQVHGATRPRINTTQLKNCVVPFCSREEQDQVIQQIESRLSVVAQLEQTIDDSLQKAEALRQSILKEAFEGRLVPQDPNDEPASVLLERIKAEKAKHSKDTVRKKNTVK